MHSHTRLIFGDLPRTALLRPHLPAHYACVPFFSAQDLYAAYWFILSTACWSRPALRPAAQPKYVPASHHLCVARHGEGGGAARAHGGAWAAGRGAQHRIPVYAPSFVACRRHVSLGTFLYFYQSTPPAQSISDSTVSESVNMQKESGGLMQRCRNVSEVAERARIQFGRGSLTF
jgi:hypothetical protein